VFFNLGSAEHWGYARAHSFLLSKSSNWHKFKYLAYSLYVKCWWNLHQGLISFTFYEQLLGQYSCAKKIFKAKLLLEKSCAKPFCMKKAYVKCWWNWHQVGNQNQSLPGSWLTRSRTHADVNLASPSWSQESSIVSWSWRIAGFDFFQISGNKGLKNKLNVTSLFWILIEYLDGLILSF